MSGKQTLSDAELVVMKLLWQSTEALSAAEITKRLHDDTGWSASTVSTLLFRMTDKEAIGYEKRSRAYYYYPLTEKKAYQIKETRSFLRKLYDGSVRGLLASLAESDAITVGDLEELQKKFHLEQKSDGESE